MQKATCSALVFLIRSLGVAVGLCVLYSGSGSAQVPSAGDIHRIDFQNFSYRPFGFSGDTVETIKTIKGSYSRKDTDGEFNFYVTDVTYGDLNGDGMDEAVVLTDCDVGHAARYSEAFLYVMRNRKPVMTSRIDGGNRADGGIRAIRIENGLLKVEQHQPEISGTTVGVAFIKTTTYRLRGSKLLPVERPVRRSFRGESRSKRIQFELGSSSAVLTGTTTGADFYVLRGRIDQTLTVRLSSKQNNARFEVIVDDYTAAYRVTEWSDKLISNSDYTIVVLSQSGRSDYKLEVAVR